MLLNNLTYHPLLYQYTSQSLCSGIFITIKSKEMSAPADMTANMT